MGKAAKKILREAVRSVCNSEEADDNYAKYSIVECAKTMYLDPDYDPFEMLQYQLMALSYRDMLGLGSDGSPSGN